MAINTRPVNGVFNWATDYIDTEQDETKLAPPVEIMQSGLLRRQPWARVWHNYTLNNISTYLKYLTGDFCEETIDNLGNKRQVENFEPIGTVKNIDQSLRTSAGVDTLTDITAAQFWGGVWDWDKKITGVSTFKKLALPTA